MNRRQGFTLVELLVALALIIFIMAILSQAFVSAMTTFRNLKASGDMAEKLRATTQLLQRDLAADHFEGKKRLSDPNFWSNGPPQQGFFQIYQTSAGAMEGTDPSVLGSYHMTSQALSFTVKLRGNNMGDFFSTSAVGGGTTPLVGTNPPQTLSTLPNFGPIESRYQNTSGGSYKYPWAAVAWFLQPTVDQTITDPTVPPAQGGGQQLYTLYRRQALLVPDNNLVQPPQAAGTISGFQEVSCWPNGANLYFNSPIDITDPQRRMWGGANAYSPLSGAMTGWDIQLTDVVSFDVRVLVQGVTNATTPNDAFVDLFDANMVTAFPTTNSSFGGTRVFDTWSSLYDNLTGWPGYANWNQTGQATSIPMWNGSSGPSIQAIQITIRIWDYKTNQTRQVTIVQAM